MVSDDLLTATRPHHPPRTSLAELGDWLSGRGGAPALVGDGSVAVQGISLSSQRILPGDLYAALPGSRTHGVSFVDQALTAGAVAVLTDDEGAAALAGRAPALVVSRPRAVLGALSARVYDEPATRLRMVGVTGTQGKTTTTRLADEALLASGTRSAVVGTVGTRINGAEVKTALTTPEAPDLHGLFARMVEDGVEACAMEVSSHALVMGRVDGVVFDVAVFTNLGRDHLDFHATLEDYYLAKASLFTPERARLALVSVDDEHGRRLAGETAVPVRTFSVRGTDADWRAVDLELSPAGSRFTVVAPDGTSYPTSVSLPGDFNVANGLAAVAAAAEAGCDPAAVAAGLARTGGVAGRLERVEGGQDFTVIVDYAHKPDALAAAVATLRPLTQGRLVVVLGAGGDRDAGKRPIMGEVVAAVADLLVVTDDNPRSEDPAAIREAVLAGASGGRAEVLEIGDRRLAIREALRRARSGDVVLIAGKGHETGQEVAGVVHPFDDRTVAAEELGRR
ncbi:MAG: UDP-N-acetylmuramoyl-L-alanyl-D-glutamate--2,6-diaminopimelate ligase [Nocardioidaceae bacterium]